MGYSLLRHSIVTVVVLLTILIPSSFPRAAEITVAWNPNGEPDLAGYKVYYGTSSRTYGLPIDVGNVTTYTLTGLTRAQTYFIAVTAYNTLKNESGYSAEVSGVGKVQLKTPFNDVPEFVKQQYRDFLNREAEAVGLQFWVNQIDSGAMTKAQVISGFLHSPEFEGRIAPIVRLYFAYFLRIPDYGGLAYWINEYNNGESLRSISEAFAASLEFQQRYGSLSNGDFVTLLYGNVLGRNPDSGGYAYWLGQLNSGAQTRGQVMLGFSESLEYKGFISPEVLVTMTYVGMLKRSPEAAGFNYWVDYMDRGQTGLGVIDSFFNSQEYANRF